MVIVVLSSMTETLAEPVEEDFLSIAPSDELIRPEASGIDAAKEAEAKAIIITAKNTAIMPALSFMIAFLFIFILIIYYL